MPPARKQADFTSEVRSGGGGGNDGVRPNSLFAMLRSRSRQRTRTRRDCPIPRLFNLRYWCKIKPARVVKATLKATNGRCGGPTPPPRFRKFTLDTYTLDLSRPKIEGYVREIYIRYAGVFASRAYIEADSFRCRRRQWLGRKSEISAQAKHSPVSLLM